MLGPVPRFPDDVRAAVAVARAAMAVDPQLAELLAAQCTRLREDTAENRERVRALLEQAAPGGLRSRGQFTLIGSALFERNVTVLEGAEGDAHAWVYEDDIVSLDAQPGEANAWVRNTAAYEDLARALDPRVVSLRLCLFEGTSRMAEALARRGAETRVTHLDVRTQTANRSDAVAKVFPRLRGLSCPYWELDALLEEPAPSLLSLDVYFDGWQPQVLDRALAAPNLRHLRLLQGGPSADELQSLAEHPCLHALSGLDLSGVHHGDPFPFERLLQLRDSFAHLEHLGLPWQVLPEATAAHLAEALPQAVLVSYDRRETMALDFEGSGWAAGAR